MHFIWLIFFNFANIRYYCVLLMSVICTKCIEAGTKSGYTNVCFTINSPLKMLPRHFWYFSCSSFKMTFDKNFMEKATIFLTSSKFLLRHKILGSGNRWQFNDYSKYPLNNSQDLQKTAFFVCRVYVNCRYYKYSIFAISRICSNCCFKATDQSDIS